MRLLVVVFFYSIALGSDASDSLGIKRVIEIRDSASAKLDDGAPFEAEILFKKALNIAHSYKIAPEFIDSEVLLRLQNCYLTIGDNRRAREIQENLVRHAKASDNERNLIYALNDLGVSYTNELNFKKAFSVYKEYNSLVTKDEDRIDGLDGLSATSIKLGYLDEGLMYLQECESLLKYGKSRFKKEQYVFYNFNKASYFLKLNDKKRAEEYLLKVVNDKLAQGYRKSILSRLELAKLYFENRKFEESMEQLSLAKLFFKSASGSSIVKDPLVVEINFFLAKILWMKGDDIGALHCIKESHRVTSFVENQYLFYESKFQLNEYNFHNLSLGVQISLDLFQKNKDQNLLLQALLFADQAKSNVLNERMQVASMVNNSVISQETRDLRFQWVYQLNEYESNGNTKMAITLRNSLDSLDQVLGLKEQKVFGVEDLKRLQATLSNDQLILQYFFIENELYTFAISRDNINLTTKEVDKDEIVRYYQLLQNPKSTYSAYSSLGQSLYGQLVQDALAANPDAKELIIIPDKSLNYLVFGTLPMSQSSGWASTSYLGDKYTITYDFSLQTLAQKSVHTSRSYAGFAPTFDASSSLSYIVGNEAAIAEVNNLLGGKTYIGKDASTQQLREEAVNAAILQLYTHGVSSDSSFDASYIHLQDRKMHVDEILTLPLQTKLCILTACEVGLGKEYSGEGVTGVSWAFRAAGADNVVQSLWRINQESSGAVMKAFFHHLADGVSSEKALQLAKRQYLNNDDISERMKHPYYWAGITHYGSGMTTDGKPWSIGTILLIAGALSLGVFAFYAAHKRLWN